MAVDIALLIFYCIRLTMNNIFMNYKCYEPVKIKCCHKFTFLRKFNAVSKLFF